MWKVFIVNADGSLRQIYSGRYTPTIDDMAIVRAVQGKKYKVLNPQGKDVTEHFPYGTPT